MRIAVNTRFLIKDNIEGMGRFTFETMQRIVLSHPEHEFIFFFDRDFSPEFIFAKNVQGVKLFPPARHPLLFIWYFEWSIYRALKKYKPDVFISCDGFLSLRSETKQLAVIHDLAFEHYPEDVPRLARYYYKIFFPRFARKATQICTVSQFSKYDLVQKYSIDANKINVVYNGASSLFKEVSNDIKETIKAQYAFKEDYFVYVGALQPRKNVRRLLLAFDAFKSKNTNPCKLLVVGRKAWKTQSIEETYEQMQFKNEVLFTGRVDDDDLAKIIASATALTYIPYLEGFGIPILEAMQCGTPVITSNRTAMPEVAGEAAIFVDPYDIDEIAKAMVTIYYNKNLQKELSTEGLAQAKKFSWEQTAKLVWDSVEKI